MLFRSYSANILWLYEQLAIPRITTNYWLNKLKDKQQIIREGSGRNTRYVVRLPESEKPPVED